MQKKKNLWYIVKLCFKLTFSFEKTVVSLACYPLSYTSLLNTSNIVFLDDKLVYTKFNNCDITNYTINDFYIVLFDIHEEFKWLYLRERRRYTYNNLQYGPFINELYFFFFKKIYNYYRFFYNSFFIKAHYAKNYNIYRSSYLIEYLWKFHFSYENTYFPITYTDYQIAFDQQHEFFKNNIFFKNDTLQEYSVEFFCFKKKFFHNSFYNFFYRTNSYVFSDNLNLPVATNNDVLLNKFFYEYLGFSITDKFVIDNSFNIKNINYTNTKYYVQLYYLLTVYLFI